MQTKNSAKTSTKQRMTSKQKDVESPMLHWGKWPSKETPLTINGQKGKWSFVQPWPCGEWEAVLLVEWNQRDQPSAPRYVVAAEDVRLPTPATLPQNTRARCSA
jgi:hypothetical protein